MYRLLFILLILCKSLSTFAQKDTASILNQDDFLQLVVENHPVVKQAQLIARRGELNLKSARGGFDPHLYSYFNQKDFKDKRYWDLFSGGLKVPTWFGVEGKLNYDNTSGIYTNPERNTPADGLVSAGVSVAVGKGLFIDERRKTLQKAKIYNEMSELDQFLALNDILYNALKTYWNWVIAYNHVKIYENSVNLANIRFEGVKKNFYQGAEPAIDTLEAYIQLQNRVFSFNEANLALTQSTLLLSNYLWTENLEPLEITTNLKAPEILDEFHNYIKSDADVANHDQFDVEQHPIYKSYQLKLNSLDIEKRYRAEALKPKLNIDYNFLTEPVNNNPFSSVSTENYKLGISFNMPLFLRQERANFQLSKVNIVETEYAQKQKVREINNKVEYYFKEIQNLEIQEKIFTVNTVNYETLLEAEKRKFEIGESSLFLINSRENKVISSQIKLIDLRGKYQKSHASLTHSMGQQLFVD